MMATPGTKGSAANSTSCCRPMKSHLLSQMLHVWNMSLQNWVIFGVNVGILTLNIPASWSIWVIASTKTIEKQVRRTEIVMNHFSIFSGVAMNIYKLWFACHSWVMLCSIMDLNQTMIHGICWLYQSTPIQ